MKKYPLIKYFLFFATASCGGSTSSPNIVPPPVNSAPSFTSASAASFVENATFSFQATASDDNNQPITFSISGGADAAAFAISGTGAITFVNAPNFDNPTDADTNNIYQLTLAASDGQLTTTQPLAVTVSNSREGIGVTRLITGFDQPIAIAPIPGDTRLFVGERNGSIWFFDPANNSRTLYTVVRPSSPISGPSAIGTNGLLGMVPAPDYAVSGSLFVALDDANGNIQVRSVSRSSVVAGIQNNSSEVLFLSRGSTPRTPAAWLGVGPDSNIYLSTGDAGGLNDPAGSAQDASFFGKLIRIRRNPDPFAGVAPSFFLFDVVASGLRQPRSFTFVGNDILIGDRGQSAFGEINRLAVTDRAVNFGWPFREGNMTVAPGAPVGLTDPVLQVAFGTGNKQGNSITIGRVFDTSVLELRSRLIFSDANGSIWTVPTSRLTAGAVLTASDFERRNEDFAPNIGSITGIVAYATGIDGRAYMLDSDGELFEIVAAS
jgi:Glucose / Sorbosone dehydrogenase